MELLAEIIVNLVILLAIYLIQWGKQHKEATVAILIIGLMIIDVLFVLRYYGKL